MTILDTQPSQSIAEDDRRRKREDMLLLAAIYWNSSHTEQWRGMLTENRGWKWIESEQSFESPTGTVLRQDTLRHLAINLVDRTELVLEKLTKSMTKEEITLDDWDARFKQYLFNETLALMMLAGGGIDHITDEDFETAWGRLGTPHEPGYGLLESLVRLGNFADEIKENSAGDEKFIVARAGGYSHYAYPVWAAVQSDSFKRARDHDGKPIALFERSMLYPGAKHCHSNEFVDGCVEAAAAGWQPIGTLPKIGHRVCGAFCKCYNLFSLMPEIPT